MKTFNHFVSIVLIERYSILWLMKQMGIFMAWESVMIISLGINFEKTRLRGDCPWLDNLPLC